MLHQDTFKALPTKQYDIILADPPWHYNSILSSGSHAKAHYPTIKTSDLKSLPVASIAAKDCLLFLWATGPILDEAIELGEAWGFKWATIGFIWDKQRINPGFYTLSQCEMCLIFKRGRIPKPRGARNIRQFLSVRCGEHSAKPDEIRHRIEAMFPQQSKLELFARWEGNADWDVWGNEAIESQQPKLFT